MPGRSSWICVRLARRGKGHAATDPIFYFDFGSPNAYLSHLVIPGHRAPDRVRSLSMCRCCSAAYSSLTNNRSPAESLAGIRNKPEYQRLETARFVQRHGIARFAPNPFFPVNTLVLMRGAIAARRIGVFERYVDEIYRHMWAEPKKLDDPDVLRAALVESRPAMATGFSRWCRPRT